jgi:methionine salvage enolase-phosphatase E1
MRFVNKSHYFFLKKTNTIKEVMMMEEKIYELICSRYDINPSEAVFLDDSEPNIIAAREFGLQEIHFHSYEQGRKELETLLEK